MRKFNNSNKLFKNLTIFLSIFWVFSFSLISLRIIERKFFYPLKYSEQVFYYSKKYNINYYLIFSMIKVESNFNKNAESNKGAKGLMQLKETTAQFIAPKINLANYDLNNPEHNINIGCCYFSYLIDKFQNIKTTIVAYNAGEGNVYTWLNDTNYSNDKITLKDIPFSESKEYLAKIEKTFKKYENLYRYIVDK